MMRRDRTAVLFSHCLKIPFLLLYVTLCLRRFLSSEYRLSVEDGTAKKDTVTSGMERIVLYALYQAQAPLPSNPQAAA